ncbi:MAG: glycosyltransferase [bacterium]|nr:glycosyltransferase [bacterium]
MEKKHRMLKRNLKKFANKLPLPWQKRTYLIWHYLNKPISLPKGSIKTDSLDLNEAEKRIKIVGFLKIRNEVQTGHLERVLKQMKDICSDIVVCDCGSTDGSKEFAQKYTKHVLSAENDFKNEIKAKAEMLDYTLGLNPDWILWLDADEVFERNAEIGAIRKLCALGEQRGIDGFEFPEMNLWKDTRHYRIDEFWNKGSYVRLWKNNGKLSFPKEGGLHKKQHPDGLDKIEKSDLAVIHYGFSSPELIQQKYDFYKEQGQEGFALDRIQLNDSSARVKEMDIDRIPFSALKVVVVGMIYQSTGYAQFVYDSFKKYQEDEEFIFVANDATDKVKDYLRENDIPHLIFENEDKDEYYLNRVYRAWNYGGMNASGDIIIFVNSDMAFSKGWVKNLLKNLNKKRIVCSRLVESGKMPSGEYGISKNFGQSYKEYNAEEFEAYVEKIKKPELKEGGLFMPCMIYKDIFVKSGGYPIGNRKEADGKETSGDHIFFYENLEAKMGVKHFTAFDSIIYHVQEGEMDE